MEGTLFKKGEILKSESGAYTIQAFLGSGGQGEVYQVSDEKGNPFAVKVYFKKTATDMQRSIINNLIRQGSPDESTFLWPLDLVTSEQGTTFGYIMKLKPKRFKSIVDLMKRRLDPDPTFYTLCRAAFQLTKGYQKLHALGLAYRDISFGNVSFDPDTGDVLIADNDNVTINGVQSSGVLGTPGFMAPEIVRGEARPSRNTDLHSLAVILFYMFFLNHPLNGRLEANIKCLDPYALERLYGTDPVFIFDPKDKRNYPVPGIHDNAIIYWKNVYPQYLKDLFTQAFTTGLHDPKRRVTEGQWLEALANLMSGIMICHCGAEVFYDESKDGTGAANSCWNCRRAVSVPAKLNIGKKQVLLYPGASIKSHHLHCDFDIDTVCGTIVQNPHNKKLWGICNAEKENWTYIKKDGTQIPVEPGRSAGIALGVKVNFGECTGEFS